MLLAFALTGGMPTNSNAGKRHEAAATGDRVNGARDKRGEEENGGVVDVHSAKEPMVTGEESSASANGHVAGTRHPRDIGLAAAGLLPN